MNHVDTTGPGRIKSLADLARFVAPDDPMSVVDALVRFRAGIEYEGGPLAQAHPMAWQAFQAWDTLDFYPTAEQLIERMTWWKDEPRPILEDFGAKRYADEVANDPRPDAVGIRWIDATAPGGPTVGIRLCPVPAHQGRGMDLYARSREVPYRWVTAHLTTGEMKLLCDVVAAIANDRGGE